MSEENRTPPAAQWGRPLRKKFRGPVPVSSPAAAPEIGPVETPPHTPGRHTGEDAGEEAGAYAPAETGAEMQPDAAYSPEPAYERPARAYERPAPREARPAREADAEDLRERDLVVFMARGLVDHPDDVSCEILTPGPEACFELHVHPDDLGHVIGKQGRTARSLRLALGAAAARLGRHAELEIAD
jgi:uncharacterized protein